MATTHFSVSVGGQINEVDAVEVLFSSSAASSVTVLFGWAEPRPPFRQARLRLGLYAF